jgi:hypothetical protein
MLGVFHDVYINECEIIKKYNSECILTLFYELNAVDSDHSDHPIIKGVTTNIAIEVTEVIVEWNCSIYWRL